MLGKRFERIIMICLIFAFTLTGCGDVNVKSLEETTLIVSKKGAVKDVIVESFDKDYYSENELKTFFDNRINEYCLGGNEGKVKLSELKVKKGVAKAVLDFDAIASYTDFYKESELYYGTINDAYDSGYSFDVSLRSFITSDIIDKSEIMEMKKAMVIITNECSRIVCPRNIAYISSNVEAIDRRNVRVSPESSGLAYIILK